MADAHGMFGSADSIGMRRLCLQLASQQRAAAIPAIAAIVSHQTQELVPEAAHAPAAPCRRLATAVPSPAPPATTPSWWPTTPMPASPASSCPPAPRR